MAISFDGPNKLISLTAGTTTLSVRDLYSRWKDWVAEGDNSKYPQAFSPVGGDTIDPGAGTTVPLYAFLENGWKIKPQEADHTLAVTTGILLVQGGGDPFVNTSGDFVVRINYQQPVQAITVSAGSGLSTPQDERLARIEKFLRNKTILDPSTGQQIVYDDDDSTPIGTGQAYEDVAGTVPYDGDGAVHRRERLA